MSVLRWHLTSNYYSLIDIFATGARDGHVMVWDTRVKAKSEYMICWARISGIIFCDDFSLTIKVLKLVPV